MATQQTQPAPTLSRDLGVSHASAIVVGTIIGSGIFLVPAEMMQAVGSARLVYLAWIVGGVLSLAGAMTYAELGAMKPQAGGEYVYIRDAYGPLPGFLYAWTWFAIAKPASIATLTIGLVRILGTFPALAFFNHNAISSPFAITYGQLVAIAAAALITALNYIGIKRAGDFQVVFTLLKIVIIVAVAMLAFTASSGTWRNFADQLRRRNRRLCRIHGRADRGAVGLRRMERPEHGERGNPQSRARDSHCADCRRGVVAVLYMLTNAAVQYVLPAASIAASPRPASDATAIAVGAWGAAIVSAGMAVSILVAMNGTIMSGARVPFAMARDGYFFKAMAEVHPRFHTPSVALDCAACCRSCCCCLRAASGNCSPWRSSPNGCSTWWRPARCSCCAGRSPTRRGLIARGDIRWCRRYSSPRRPCCCITRSPRTFGTLRGAWW